MTMSEFMLPAEATSQCRREVTERLRDAIHADDIAEDNIWSHIREFDEKYLKSPAEYGRKIHNYFAGRIPICVAEVLNDLRSAVDTFIVWHNEGGNEVGRFIPLVFRKYVVRLMAKSIADSRALDNVLGQ